MKHLIILSWYSIYILLFMEFVDKNFLNLSVIFPYKYVVIILNTILIFSYLYKNNIRLKINNSTKLLFIAISIILLHSVLFSEDIPSSLLRSLLFLSVVASIIGTSRIYGGKKSLDIVNKFLFISAILISVLSDYLLYINMNGIFVMGNFKSFFSNANGLGSVIGLFLLPMLLLKILIAKNKIHLFVYLLLFLNLFIILFLTRSRAALLAFIIIVSFFSYYKYIVLNRKPLKNTLIITSILLITSAIIFSNKNTVEFLNLYLIKHENLSGQGNSRTYIWNERIEGISERPLVGWGYGINSSVYLYKGSDFSTEKGNSILSILEEFGMFFGALIIFILSYIFYALLRVIKKNKFTRVHLLYCTILIGCLVHVNFESWLFYLGNANAMLFWFILINLTYLRSTSYYKI